MGLHIIVVSCFGQKPIGNYSCGHNHQSIESIQKKSSHIDVLHYSINLDFTDFDNQTLSGYTALTIVPTESTTKIQLQLEGLKVDSVIKNHQSLGFSRDGINLYIVLDKAISAADTIDIKVYYSGKPKRDASWGGFYYSGDYAFNLGVAFTSNPHNYGRVWYPCLDNFTDRATYSYNIICTDDKKAMCNGLSTGVTNNGNGTSTHHWELKQPIPTYLSSVAIAPYTLNEYTHNGIPVVLSSIATDSLDMAKSFRNLNGCIDAYVARYGAHTFDRIGFNAVPFNGGAMEHATNIAYPNFGIDGDLTYETLFAHELGHHWWGNTVTCKTAEDMWINEGWASYSERVFLEWIYGKDRYDEDISSNHRAVLHYAHLRDGDTLPISGIGHNHTYGSHVYDKGADVVHTLRGYMGDSSFFEAVQTFLVKFKFQDVSSTDLESHFQNYTQQNLKAFFEQWVYNPGFPHFAVLGFDAKPKGDKYLTSLVVGQRKRFAPDFFDNVPMDITFYAKDFSTQTYTIRLGKERQQMMLETDFVPVYVALDMHKKISDAITDDYKWIKDTGSYEFGDAMMTVQVKSSSDSSLVRVEHNWVGADSYFNKELPFISRERYWNIDGVWNSNFKADATIEYFGRETGNSYLLGYLDVDLIRNTEESMVLMYRSSPSANWEVCADYTWKMGSKYDKRGSFTIHNVQKGQYAFAVNEADRLSVKPTPTQSTKYVSVYPNPTTDTLTMQIIDAKGSLVEITDGNGRLVAEFAPTSNEYRKQINVTNWAKGIYYIGVVMDNKPYQPKRVLVR
jgi:aminopeptidase N